VPFGVIHATPNFMLKDDVKAVSAAINAAQGAEVIVVDTFAQVTPGANENAGEDMGLALKHARRIGEETGAVVILVHHSGKDEARGARGWSGLRAAADAELEVVKTPAGRWMRTTKQKDGDDTGEWGFQLAKVAIGEDDRGREIESCVVLEAGVPEDRRRGAKAAPAEVTDKWQKAVLDAMAELTIGQEMVPRPDLTEATIRMREGDNLKSNIRSQRLSARDAIDALIKARRLGVENNFVMVREEE
jgi:hypothetical protein